MLLAAVGGYSLIQLAIFIIVIAGIIAIVFVVTKQLGVQIPPFVVMIFWIILAVVIGVVAVKFLASML